MAASIIAVTTASDIIDASDGVTSLREAIRFANSIADQTTIQFNLGGGTKTIHVGVNVGGTEDITGQGLDAITSSVIFDVTTFGTHVIELDGTGTSGANGLTLEGGSSTITGLVINNFDGHGIFIDGSSSGSSGNLITGNYIGTNAGGSAGAGNSGDGVQVVNSSFNTITGNVISANSGDGISLYDGGLHTGNNLIENNKIGTDVTGAKSLGNHKNGVYLFGVPATTSTADNTITGNVIAGNASNGVLLEGANVYGNLITSNRIGTDATGTKAADGAGVLFGNGGNGVYLLGNDDGGVNNNSIGGTSSYNTTDGLTGEGNLISNNQGDGIRIEATNGAESYNNNIYGNFIGTDIFGTAALGNRTDAKADAHGGVALINVGETTVGGTTGVPNLLGGSFDGNLISGNAGDGVYITGNGFAECSVTANVVQSNFIGLNIAGTGPLANTGNGVTIDNSRDNTVGGGARPTATVATVDGTDEPWDPSLNPAFAFPGNGATPPTGVSVTAGQMIAVAYLSGGVSIGDVTPVFWGADGDPDDPINQDDSNYPSYWIDAAENPVNHTALVGAFVDDSGVIIGGPFKIGGYRQLIAPVGATQLLLGVNDDVYDDNSGSWSIAVTSLVPPGNVISGNGGAGVSIQGGAQANYVQGNLIGTDVSGTAAVGNTAAGVEIIDSSFNTVGGFVPDSQSESTRSGGNIISANGTGVVIAGSGAAQNIVAGNFIGTDISGTAALGNESFGVIITDGASSNSVGGVFDDPFVGESTVGGGNLISGNALDGLVINSTTGDPTTNNVVQGNFIGTDVTGATALGNGGHGVVLFNTNGSFYSGPAGNLIGGLIAPPTSLDLNYSGEGNVVSGNAFNGVYIDGNDEVLGTGNPALGSIGNEVRKNFIGTDAFGTAGIGNGEAGVYLGKFAFANIVGSVVAQGAPLATGNIISANPVGIVIDWDSVTGSPSANDVRYNSIGADANGNALGNAVGVRYVGDNGVIDDASAVGPGMNLIAANGVAVEVAGSGNTVTRLRIGDDMSGNPLTSDLENVVGLLISGSENFVGGSPFSLYYNVVYNNSGDGIRVTGSDNVLQNNYVGIDSDGDTTDVGNGGNGIVIEGAGNLVGGTKFPGSSGSEGNLISNNGGYGVVVRGSGATDNVIAGNFIGTDINGTAARGNSAGGVLIRAANTTVGAKDKIGIGNVISGNGGDGVVIQSEFRQLINGSFEQGNWGDTEIPGWIALNDEIEIQSELDEVNFPSDGDRFVELSSETFMAIQQTIATVPGQQYLLSFDFAARFDSGVNRTNVYFGSMDLDGLVATVEADADISTDWTNHTFTLTATSYTTNLIFEAIATFGSVGNLLDNVSLVPLDGGDPAEATGNVVTGNYIGTDVTGLEALGNAGDGVQISNASDNQVTANVISANTNYGVNIQSGSTGNKVLGNFIGVGSDGKTTTGTDQASTSLGNGSSGVRISGADGNYIGEGTLPKGLSTQGGNVIANNNDAGVYITGGASGNWVDANFIGIDATGAKSGNYYGVQIDGAGGNIIGRQLVNDAVVGAGNVIGGNIDDGVQLNNATGNSVAGNWIGTNAAGADLGNGSDGVYISEGSGNAIGGVSTFTSTDSSGKLTSTSLGNTIRFNDAGGVQIFDSNGNSVQGNRITENGTFSDDYGVLLIAGGEGYPDTSYNLIGGSGRPGTDAFKGNWIAGNYGDGVRMESAAGGEGEASTHDNVVAGNLIGTNLAGTGPYANSRNGVYIAEAAFDNSVGGATSDLRNIISGNGANGVLLEWDYNVVQGNYIGTTAAGDAPLANVQDGVHIDFGYDNTISGNFIAANGANGVYVVDAIGNVIVDNTIGATDLANGGDGIHLDDFANSTFIGSNSITNNNGNGITIWDAYDNIAQGNFISTNGEHGVEINYGASGNLIGGSRSGGEGNTIVDNLGYGVLIANDFSSGSGNDRSFISGSQLNFIQGNLIGLNSSGTALGNGGHGVLLRGGVNNNFIGFDDFFSPDLDLGNIIAFNGVGKSGGDGVAAVVDRSGTPIDNAIVGNNIYSNAGLRIDLNDDGVTENDYGDDEIPPDNDYGPNYLQNFVTFGTATISNNVVSIPVTLTTNAGSPNVPEGMQFYVEFWGKSSSSDSLTYLGAQFIDVTEDGSVTFTFSFTASSTISLLGATVTRLENLFGGQPAFAPQAAGGEGGEPSYFLVGSTSEFSDFVTVPTSNPPPDVTVTNTLEEEPRGQRAVALAPVLPPEAAAAVSSLNSLSLRNIQELQLLNTFFSKEPLADSPGEIHGRLFDDINAVGQKADGTLPLSGYQVYIDMNGNGQLDEGEPITVTNEKGEYSFTGLRSGQYIVRPVLGRNDDQTFGAREDNRVELRSGAMVINNVDFGVRIRGRRTAPRRTGMLQGLDDPNTLLASADDLARFWTDRAGDEAAHSPATPALVPPPELSPTPAEASAAPAETPGWLQWLTVGAGVLIGPWFHVFRKRKRAERQPTGDQA